MHGTVCGARRRANLPRGFAQDSSQSPWEQFVKSAVVFCILGSLLSAAVGCSSREARELWVVPAGYVGWLRLDYSVGTAAPLTIEGGRYIIRFSPSGRVLTSSANKPRADRNEYRIVGPDGTKRLDFSGRYPIDGYAVQSAYSFGQGTLGGGWRTAEAECVFIGTRADFQRNGRNCAAWRLDLTSPPNAHQ